MLTGLLCALGAGLMWGLVFIVPVMLPDYPGLVLSFGRYIAFGLIALIPAYLERQHIVRLSKADWIVAIKLSLVGNLLYYAALATAIQLAETPLPAMLIGTLPVVIALYANWSSRHFGETMPWKRLAPSLLLLFTGLMLVNASELAQLNGKRPLADYALGCVIALGAVAAWTWYPVVNARHLKMHPHIRSSTWATAQGLATLPLALAGFGIWGVYDVLVHGTYAFPFGARPEIFIALMLTVGLCASWIGTLLWNQASKRLPTTLAGQLIVFETLSALLYAFIWRGTLPEFQVLAGAMLLCAGVVLGVRVYRADRHPQPPAP